MSFKKRLTRIIYSKIPPSLLDASKKIYLDILRSRGLSPHDNPGVPLQTVQETQSIRSQEFLFVDRWHFSTFRRHQRQAGSEVVTLCSSEKEKIPPTEFKHSRNISLNLSDEGYSSPECRIYRFSNAHVLSRTDFIFAKSNVFHDRFYSPKKHITTIEQLGKGTVEPVSGTLSIEAEVVLRLKAAINLCAGGAGNYAHFLFEVVPRLVLLDSSEMLQELPIVADGWVGKRIMESLIFFNKFAREIYGLDSFKFAKVLDLHHITSPNWAPQDFRCEKVEDGFEDGDLNFTAHDYRFSTRSAEIVRKYAWGKIGGNRLDRMSPRLIYLRRTNEFIDGVQYNIARGIINDEEVLRIVKSFGFSVVDITKLTFVDQIKLFFNAQLIVAPLGAALANCVFSRPGTRVIGLAAYYREADYSYHRRMMAACRVEYSLVLGSQLRSGPGNPLHHSYFIESECLKSKLTESLGQLGFLP